MAGHSAALKAVEAPVESGIVDDARQTDIEAAAITEAHDHAANAATAIPDALYSETALMPVRRGRKPRADAGVPRKAAAPSGPKLVPAPVPVGTVPTPPMSVAAALALIPQGTEMTILGATWHEVNAAADELGIRAHIWTRQTAHGVDVDHRSHGFDPTSEMTAIVTAAYA
jgi:hypothetical protein